MIAYSIFWIIWGFCFGIFEITCIMNGRNLPLHISALIIHCICLTGWSIALKGRIKKGKNDQFTR